MKDRLWGKIQSWLSKPYSKAGREVFIKSATQAIPAYYMSVFFLPSSTTTKLERMLNFFWWGLKKEGSRGTNWMSWEHLCIRKENGGLGFKDFQAFNLAMLRKQGWNLISNTGTLVSRLPKTKYFLRVNFLNAQVGHNPSFIWRSILCS